MKKLLKIAFVFLLLMTTSCSNENNDIIDEPQANGVSPTLVTSLKSFSATAASTNQATNYINNEEAPCFTWNYPITLVDNADGVTTTIVNSQEEFLAYLTNSVDGFNFEFPFSVTLEDGTVETIENEEQFFLLFENCDSVFVIDDIVDFSDDGYYADECLALDFPLDVIDNAGNQVTVNSGEELFLLEGVNEFVYPITGTLVDGTVVTVNSSEEFDTIYNDCYGYGIDECLDCDEDFVNCFEIVYPFTLVDQDGTIVTVNNDNELFDYLNQLSPTDTFVCSYPLNVEYEDGTLLTINSDEEFETALNACD